MIPTVNDVRAIILTKKDDAQVQAFIDDAVLLTKSCGFDGALQKAILRWVTAHLISSTVDEGVVTSDALGGASRSYARASLGNGLAGTTYGQQALALDTAGCLARLGSARASIEKV